jgi:quinoprotein glucose dehydrogenase
MPSEAVLRRRPWVLAAVLLLPASVLIIGGTQLLLLRGSAYYLMAGLVMALCAVLALRRSCWSAYLYGWLLVGTLPWALWESGFNGWALAPRVLPLLLLGSCFLIPRVRRTLGRQPRPAARPDESAVKARITLAVLLCAVLSAAMVNDEPPDRDESPHAATTPSVAGEDWSSYGGTPAGQRFSSLSQINTRNVDRLQLLWTYHTGDPGKAAEVTSLKVGDTLFLCTPHNIVAALDAETGAQRWRFDPKVDASEAYTVACRGVSYFEQPKASGPCAARIIEATVDARLLALDARTGALCADFGNGGYVNLLDHLGEVTPGFYYVTSPPTVINGHVVLGAYIRDNQSTNEPSGVVRSFDAVTGALQWAWDVGAPERIGAPAAGDTYTRDTPNAWTVFAADPQLNIVYVPTGNAPPDFFGGHRRSIDDQFSSSLVALDVDSGRPRWSFQTTHHDLWDYDVPAQPVLMDLPVKGGSTPAVVQATKTGEIFVLDRRNGHPIFAVDERPVPQDGVPGERLSATQPFSAITLRPPPLSEAQMWGVTPIDQMVCRILFRSSRYEGVYTPPGFKPVIVFPGSLGIIDWGGISVDPDRAVMIANISAVAFRSELVLRENAPTKARTIQAVTINGKPGGADYTWSPQIGTPYVSHTKPFMGPLNIPCTQPPWGLLQAVDLKSGRTLWKRPIGTAQDSGPLGIGSRLPILMGVPNIGGSLLTRGGLLFNSATLDRYLRAYAADSGKQLWQSRLPAGGQATPMTYLSPSGRQVVVVSAGGHPGLKTLIGDSIVAYALPR